MSNGYINYKRQFSIAMLDYQRGKLNHFFVHQNWSISDLFTVAPAGPGWPDLGCRGWLWFLEQRFGPLVNWHNYGKSHFFLEQNPINGHFPKSKVMLNHQRVTTLKLYKFSVFVSKLCVKQRWFLCEFLCFCWAMFMAFPYLSLVI